MDSLGSLIDLLEELTALLESTSDFSYSLAELSYAVMAIFSLLASAVAIIVPIITTGVGLIIFVITTIFSIILFIIGYLVRAVPVFAIAKKTKCKFAWFAWIPIYQRLFCLFVLSKSSTKSDFEFWNGKIKIKERIYSFLIYLALYFFGYSLITAFIAILNLIPGLGQILGAVSMLLYLIPTVVCAIIEYVYFRDVLDLFKSDKKSNCIHATAVTILDNLVTLDFARSIYLFTILKCNPIHQSSVPEDEEPLFPVDDPIEDFM